MGLILELLGPLIVLSIPLAVGIYGWKYYSGVRLKREFEELRLSNPKLHQKILHEINSYSNFNHQPLVDDLGPKIWADYKKGFKVGLTAKEIHKQRQQTNWGPF